jgi:hypothetical protein
VRKYRLKGVITRPSHPMEYWVQRRFFGIWLSINGPYGTLEYAKYVLESLRTFKKEVVYLNE